MHPDFRKLLATRFLFTLAVDMQAVVVGWRMYELTGDPLYLGLVGLSEAVPALSLAIFAGYVVDRSRPVFIYRGVVFASLASGLLLLAAQLFGNSLGSSMQIAAMFVASALTGMGRAFSQPSTLSILPRLWARKDLARASAWMSSVRQVGRIAGPAMGGLIFGFAGALAAKSFIVALLTAAMVGAMLIRVKIDPPKNPNAGSSIGEELMSGMRFVFRHPILLPAMSLDMISVLFGGVTALLPIFAKEILFLGPKGLGLLRAAPAIGAVFTALWLTRVNLRHRAGPVLLGSVAGFGLSILLFAFSRDFLLSMVALGLSGAFDSVSTVIRGTAVQLSSPDHMRGRISSVNSMFIGSSNELGEFESGLVAKLFGTVPAVYLGGLVCLATVATIGLFCPALRKLDIDAL